MVPHEKCDHQDPLPLSLVFQIDPKVAFPRRAQPKVGVSVSGAIGGMPLSSLATPGSDFPCIPSQGRGCFWNV